MPTHTFTLETVDDVDGLLTEDLAPTEATLYRVEDFDGEFALECGDFGAARTITITLSAGRWSAEDVIDIEGFYGLRDGRPVFQSETLEIPAEAGEVAVTIRGAKPFMFPPGVTVTIPAQPYDEEANPIRFSIGVGDVVAAEGERFADLKATADGRLGVAYANQRLDTIHMKRGERLGLSVRGVVADVTEGGVTLFFG